MIMRRLTRNLNLVMAGLIVVVAGFLAALFHFSQDSKGGQEGLNQEKGEEQALSVEELSGAQQRPGPGGSRLVEPNRADLRVTITNLDGRELEKARLVGWGPLAADEQPELDTDDLPNPDQGGIYADLDLGRWVIRAEAPLHLPKERTIELQPGEMTEVTLALRPAVVVEGSFVNTFGSPMGNGWIWFLPPDRKHPDVPRVAEGLVKARVDREGLFESPLLPPGKYKMSFGPVGRSHLMDEQPWPLKGGTRYTVKGVVSYKSQVEVEVAGLAGDESRRMEVLLLEPRDRGRASREDRGQKERGGTGEEERPEKWKEGAERTVKDGSARFTRLREGRYRIGFVLGALRFQSEQEIHLGKENFLRVTAHVAEAVGGTKREPGPLPIEVEELAPDISLGRPGFHILSEER
jgi:hypothetical protein